MRRLAILTVFFIFTCVSNAQVSNPSPDTSKYSLQIPDFINSPHFLLLFTHFIEKKIPSLNTKEICVGCNLGTIVSLHIDTPTQAHHFITDLYSTTADGLNRYRCTTVYNFSAYITIKDLQGADTAQIILIDSSEDFEINREFYLRPHNSTRYPQRRNGVSYIVAGRARTFETAGDVETNINGIDPYDYVKQHEKEMLPRDGEILRLVKARINAAGSN